MKISFWFTEYIALYALSLDVMRLRCLVNPKSKGICVCVCVRLSPFVRKFMTILMDKINAIEKNYEHSKYNERLSVLLSLFAIEWSLKPFECVCHRIFWQRITNSSSSSSK